MPSFSALDGATMAYNEFGDGPPLVCLVGGPLADSIYLGDLGGLSAHRRLVMLDLRLTGERDAAAYRCDRLVDDVEALREHLGLDRIDLLAHCAGANLAALYAARHPRRAGRLALIAPSVTAVGIETPGDLRLEVARLRQDEPWFPAAFAALEALVAGDPPEDWWQAIAPFYYGRWDERAQAHRAGEDERRNPEAETAYVAEGAYDPPVTRAALAQLDSPVLVLAGEVDVAAPPGALAGYAELFPNAEYVVQPGAGHFPWLDDAGRFVSTTAVFLR